MPPLLTGTPLSGRVAVLSGASSGMGAAAAERFAVLGASVVVLARRKERLDDVVRRVEEAGGKALAIAVDVTDRAAVQVAADRVAERFGKSDLVFNNAGVQIVSGIEELKIDDWQRQIDLNISGLMNVIGAFLPHLTDSAAEGKPADLINTSSVAATRILPRLSVYSGTKAYISQLTRLLRVELGPKMVRVATIEPGMVDTELPDHVGNADTSRYIAALLNDIDVLQGADIAETVAFMAALPRHVNLSEITVFPTAQAL
ncbi:SDR family oxidoreductase [Streptomyces sp. NPDC047002]|uniref:SDR family oxidoreductase n=1 Tax=Streptomyces sp. NPDC047002 TaxID=3155475 RepID=UPI003453B097